MQKKKRRYGKPGLRSFESDRLSEDAAMAFLQAGSPTELICTPNTVPPDKEFCGSGDYYCPTADECLATADVPR